MFADLHIHMLLSGADWKAAIAGHQPSPDDALIRRRLAAYQAAGITYLRDGGDRFGVCLRAKELAPEYGITYRTPAFPIYKNGHYGSFIGRGWSDLTKYRALLAEAKAAGADFIKLMVSGLMDFSVYGRLTEEPLTGAEMRDLIAAAHDMGYAVMAHCNGAEAVKTPYYRALTASSTEHIWTMKPAIFWRKAAPSGCPPCPPSAISSAADGFRTMWRRAFSGRRRKTSAGWPVWAVTSAWAATQVRSVCPMSTARFLKNDGSVRHWVSARTPS